MELKLLNEISPGPINVQDGPQLKPRDEQWCAGCAQQGHLEFECNSYRYSREYPSVLPFITEYTDVYHISDSVFAPVTNYSPKINPFSMTRNIPNSQAQENNFVQLNRSIFDSPYANTSIAERPPESFRQQVINPFSFFNDSDLGQPSCSNSRTVELSYDDSPTNSYDTSKQTHTGCTTDLFQTANIQYLQRFIKREIVQLHRSHHVNITKLKKRFFMTLQTKRSYQRSIVRSEPVYNTTELYRQLNMCIFGVNCFENGKKHLDYLKNFVVVHPRSGLSMAKRDNIRIAHEYIFGECAHKGFNYHRALTILSMPYIKKGKQKGQS